MDIILMTVISGGILTLWTAAAALDKTGFFKGHKLMKPCFPQAT